MCPERREKDHLRNSATNSINRRRVSALQELYIQNSLGSLRAFKEGSIERDSARALYKDEMRTEEMELFKYAMLLFLRYAAGNKDYHIPRWKLLGNDPSAMHELAKATNPPTHFEIKETNGGKLFVVYGEYEDSEVKLFQGMLEAIVANEKYQGKATKIFKQIAKDIGLNIALIWAQYNSITSDEVTHILLSDTNFINYLKETGHKDIPNAKRSFDRNLLSRLSNATLAYSFAGEDPVLQVSTERELEARRISIDGKRWMREGETLLGDEITVPVKRRPLVAFTTMSESKQLWVYPKVLRAFYQAELIHTEGKPIRFRYAA